jgi:hypothetical protein
MQRLVKRQPNSGDIQTPGPCVARIAAMRQAVITDRHAPFAGTFANNSLSPSETVG